MRRTFLSLGLGLLAVGLTTLSSQGAVVFDNISNAENGVNGAALTSTGSTPNTFMGDGYTLVTGTTSITGFDLFPYNNTGTNFTGLRITIYVWGTVNGGTTSPTNPAFSNLLNTYSFDSTSNFATGSYFAFENATPGSAPGISLTLPQVVIGNSVGITVNYQGTTDGTTFASATNLTSIISYGTAPTTGSLTLGAGVGGYYRNANSETNGNFTSTLRSLGLTYQGVALRVYGNVAAPVPEPSAWTMIVLGGVVVAWQVRRRPFARA